jgi:hypothetical protein
VRRWILLSIVGPALMQGGLVRRLSGAAARMIRNLPGEDRIPGGDENWIPGGDGDPFSLEGRKIPGSLGELTANGRGPVRTLSPTGG